MFQAAASLAVRARSGPVRTNPIQQHRLGYGLDTIDRQVRERISFTSHLLVNMQRQSDG